MELTTKTDRCKLQIVFFLFRLVRSRGDGACEYLADFRVQLMRPVAATLIPLLPRHSFFSTYRSPPAKSPEKNSRIWCRWSISLYRKVCTRLRFRLQFLFISYFCLGPCHASFSFWFFFRCGQYAICLARMFIVSGINKLNFTDRLHRTKCNIICMQYHFTMFVAVILANGAWTWNIYLHRMHCIIDLTWIQFLAWCRYRNKTQCGHIS